MQALAAGIRAIAAQEEPIGRQISKMEIADGLLLEKVRPPLHPVTGSPAVKMPGWDCPRRMRLCRHMTQAE